MWGMKLTVSFRALAVVLDTDVFVEVDGVNIGRC